MKYISPVTPNVRPENGFIDNSTVRTITNSCRQRNLYFFDSPSKKWISSSQFKHQIKSFSKIHKKNHNKLMSEPNLPMSGEQMEVFYFLSLFSV